MLNLHAAIHDHVQPSLDGDSRALRTDNAELKPEGAGANVHGFPSDTGYGIRGAEDVHDVDGKGNRAERG
jgi:hypothetical protein